MNAVVVFESMFGNTEVIARAIADGVATRMPVDVRDVNAGPPGSSELSDLQLLIVGGPTHAFSMSRPSTREDAGRRGAAGAREQGVREWLAGLNPQLRHAAVAAFDTKVNKPRLPGSAAIAATRRLRRMGFHIVAPAHSFFVTDVNGPLLEGEVERARSWGVDLASAVVPDVASATTV